jgi:hypothetical protein
VGFLLCSSLIGCFATAIGDPGHAGDWREYQFGTNEQVRVCTWRDSGVSAEEVRNWIDEWNVRHDQEVMITLVSVDKGELPRDGFTHNAISSAFERQVSLTNDCDRDLYFVGRNLGDFLYGVLAFTTVPLPETLGETDDLTLTHAFVVARRATVMNLVFSPEDITEHEIWHLLGCKQHYDWDLCYSQIAALKQEHERLVEGDYFKQIGEQPFYPTWDNLSERFLVSRAEVNSRFNSSSGSEN